MPDQWDEFDDAPSAGATVRKADPWAEFDDATSQKKSQSRTKAKLPPVSGPSGKPPHDGDTFPMSDGGNARLSGYDAFELAQTGMFRDGPHPIGQQSRDYLGNHIDRDSIVAAAGKPSYGRPVVTVKSDGADVGQEALRDGWGLVTPEYLRHDPDRFHQYMEAERLARLNRLGAHAGQFQSPKEFRDGKPDPWAKPEAGEYGNSIAVFADEPTPFQGLRKDVEQGYLAIAKDPKSTAADLVAYADANGFQIDPKEAERFIKERVTRGVADGVAYKEVPQVLTDPGDGAIGAGARGLADPINMIDEVGAVLDSIGLTPGRENVWNSDRRLGDVLWNNIDQNRSILAHDDAEHPYARLGGQLASGLVIPGASVDGVAASAVREVLAAGGSRYAAAQAAKAAVRRRLAIAGSGEGFAAGYGAGEGGPVDRLPGAGIGAVAGAGLGVAGGEIINAVSPTVRRLTGRSAQEIGEGDIPGRGAVEDVGGVGESSRIWDEFDDAPPEVGKPSGSKDAYRQTTEWDEFDDAPNAIAAMRNEEGAGSSITSPRVADRIDVGDRTRNLLTPATAAQIDAAGQKIEPVDVLPFGGTASEEGAEAPNFAGNIRLENLNSPQDISRALKTTDARLGGFDASRRGTITHQETQALANDLGMTVDGLISRRHGQAFNAEEALAARQILAKSGNELVNMARRVQQSDDPGEEALAAFRQAWVRHVAIQEQVSGMTAEAGRTLAQFRMVADGRNVRGNILNALSEGGGGRDRLKAAADLILDGADDPAKLNANARQALKPKLLDKINELWINSLLSGPQTHAVNIVGNTMTALAQIPEHAAAASIGALRRIGGHEKAADRVMFSEIGARSIGLLQGAKEGMAAAARTLRTGEESDFANKVEAQAQQAISGLKGKIIRTPTRFLSAEDELFKGMARRMELAGLAVRTAKREGLSGDAGRTRVAELLANPTDEMLEKAFDYGRYVTFQRPLGAAGRHISQFTQSMPGAKFILPFVRTPTNLLKFTIERSPAAPLIDTWRADFKAGGARRDLAVAKALVGSGVGAAVMEMAGQGFITGAGPADDGAKQIMRADGWQPYSVRIGDKYYSYQRLDPFASTLGIAASMSELQDHMTDRQRDNVAMLVTASIMQSLTSKTWLSGIGNLVEAVNDPARYAGDFIERLVSSAAVPAGVAQVARTVDPTLREAEGILDAIRARIPGESKKLPPRRDVWGEPQSGEGGVGPDIISPLWLSSRKNDPINEALLAAGAHISRPKREVDGRRLSAEEYGKYRELTGALGRHALGEAIGSSEWEAMSRDDQQDAVSDIMRDARKQAKAALFP
jgi:endonuclease YncB( thermonuclease family)